MSKTGPNHDGVCIFLNGKEPYQFAAKAPQQPLYSMLPAGENSGVLDRSGQGLKFYPYLEEERREEGKTGSATRSSDATRGSRQREAGERKQAMNGP